MAAMAPSGGCGVLEHLLDGRAQSDPLQDDEMLSAGNRRIAEPGADTLRGLEERNRHATA